MLLPLTPSKMASPNHAGYSNGHLVFVSCPLGRISSRAESYLSHLLSRAINYSESPCHLSPSTPYSWRLLGCCCCCYSYGSKWGAGDVWLGRDFSKCSAKQSQIGRNCRFLQYLALYRPSAVPHFTSSFLASPFESSTPLHHHKHVNNQSPWRALLFVLWLTWRKHVPAPAPSTHFSMLKGAGVGTWPSCGSRTLIFKAKKKIEEESKSKEHELDKYDQLPGTCLKPPAAVVDIRKLRSLGDGRKFYCLAPTRSTRLPLQLPGATRRVPVTGITGHQFSPPAPAASPRASERLFHGKQLQCDIFPD